MMTPTMLMNLRKLLIEHEGYEKFPYPDTVGKITIGIGYNLSDRGIDDDWINNQFLKDLYYFHDQLSKFDWFESLNEARQVALVDMCFMGIKRFMSFKKMIAALSLNDYDTAAKEMLNSKWATQVGKRANCLANIIRTGGI